MNPGHFPDVSPASGVIAQNVTSPSPGAASLTNTFVQTDRISPLFNPNSSLADFFSALFYTALAVGAVLAVLRLGYAGFMYMTSDVWGKIDKAKTIMQETVLGRLLLLAVYLILYQINPDILNLNILRNVRPAQNIAPTTQSSGGLQQFTTPPAPNSFFGGSGGQFDPSINGSGVGGFDTFNPETLSP